MPPPPGQRLGHREGACPHSHPGLVWGQTPPPPGSGKPQSCTSGCPPEVGHRWPTQLDPSLQDRAGECQRMLGRKDRLSPSGCAQGGEQPTALKGWVRAPSGRDERFAGLAKGGPRASRRGQAGAPSQRGIPPPRGGRQGRQRPLPQPRRRPWRGLWDLPRGRAEAPCPALPRQLVGRLGSTPASHRATGGGLPACNPLLWILCSVRPEQGGRPAFPLRHEAPRQPPPRWAPVPSRRAPTSRSTAGPAALLSC